MTAYTPSALATLTACCSSEAIATTARRTGSVQRASTITGTIFLPLVTCGLWSDAPTTLAQLAAQVTALVGHLEVSPEAIYQRLNKRAHALLQEMIRHALAKGQARDTVWDDGLFTYLPKGYLVDSPGVGLPDMRQDLCPGSGGSAAKAGANMQAADATVCDLYGACAACCAIMRCAHRGVIPFG
jgi:hypothetical protein